MGVVANTYWQLPNVLRSDSPHAFAAQGPEAARITAPHPVGVDEECDEARASLPFAVLLWQH